GERAPPPTRGSRTTPATRQLPVRSSDGSFLVLSLLDGRPGGGRLARLLPTSTLTLLHDGLVARLDQLVAPGLETFDGLVELAQPFLHGLPLESLEADVGLELVLQRRAELGLERRARAADELGRDQLGPRLGLPGGERHAIAGLVVLLQRHQVPADGPELGD